jgi:hypothetical protein
MITKPVSDNKDERLRRHCNDSGNNRSVNARVGIKKLQSSGWITAVRGPAGLFVDARYVLGGTSRPDRYLHLVI